MSGIRRFYALVMGAVLLAVSPLSLIAAPGAAAAGLGGSSSGGSSGSPSGEVGGSSAKIVTKSCAYTTKARAKLMRGSSTNAVKFDVFLSGSHVSEGYVYCSYESGAMDVSNLRYRFRCEHAKRVTGYGKPWYECSE